MRVPISPGIFAAVALVSASSNGMRTKANALTALRLAPDWQGVLAYDEFRNKCSGTEGNAMGRALPRIGGLIKRID
jgi:hypothetical protein